MSWTLEEAARALRVSPRVLRRLRTYAAIVPTTCAHDERFRLLSDDDMSALRTHLAATPRRRSSAPVALSAVGGRGDDAPVGASGDGTREVAAHVSEMRRMLTDLAARVEHLSAAPVTAALKENLRSAAHNRSDGAPTSKAPARAARTTRPLSASERAFPRAPAVPSGFNSHCEAARWLVPHGVRSALTPRSWPGWSGVSLTPRAVLAFALDLEHQWRDNHRVTWRLRRCGEAGCICAELLAEGLSKGRQAAEQHDAP